MELCDFYKLKELRFTNLGGSKTTLTEIILYFGGHLEVRITNGAHAKLNLTENDFAFLLTLRGTNHKWRPCEIDFRFGSSGCCKESKLVFREGVNW